MADNSDEEDDPGRTQFSKSCRQIYGNLAENKKSSRVHPVVNSNHSSFDGGVMSPVGSARDFNSLTRDASPHLEWKVSEGFVRWITAGRDIEEECPNMLGSDIVNWKLKVTGMLLYGAAQMLVAIVAAVIYLFDGKDTPVIVLLGHSATVFASFLVLTIINCLRLVSQTVGVTYCSAFLVLLCTAGPSLHFLLGASSEVCGTLIWNLGGPAGALFLLPRPIFSLTAVMAARIILDIAVLFASHATHIGNDGHSPLINFFVLTISHTLCPLAIAFMFRVSFSSPHPLPVLHVPTPPRLF
eukprot:98697-Rhodomonas_salina.1